MEKKEVEPLPRVRQLPRDQIIRDICGLIRIMPLTTKQVELLYDAITERRAKEK
jgi:hypothetical protein